MLQSLRDKAQGWIAWIIIGMIAITFILFGTENFFKSGRDNTVADVQGTPISVQELDMAYKRYLNQAGNESVAKLDPTFVKKEILQSMIDETIMMSDAKKIGLTISQQRIGLMLNSIPFFIKDGHFSEDAYARFLMNTGYTDKSFQSYIKTALIKQQLEQGLMQTSFSLPSDLDTLVKYILQKRDFRFLTIDRAALEKDIVLKDDEIKAYYEKHLNDFKTEEQVAVEYVVLSLQKLMDEYQPTEEEIQAYYHENAALFNDPERVQVAHILISVPKNADEKTFKAANERILDIQNRLKKGESFESLAKSLSDDKTSAVNGGKLEWISKGEMIPEFEKSAFALANKGDVSEPVHTEFGLHLIKLLDKQKAKSKSFDTVKDDIVAKMKHESAQEKFATLADNMNDLAFDHADSLQPIVDKLGIKIEKSDYFTKTAGPKEKILQNALVTTAAFNPNVKDDKNNSDLIKLDPENYLVLRVSNVIASKQKPLEEVKSEIVKTLLFDKSTLEAKTKATSLLDKITKNNMPLDKVQSEFSWSTATDVSRSSSKAQPDLVEAAFGMAYPTDKGSFKLVQLENGDYAIVWLTKVVDGDMSKLSAQEKESFNDQLSKHFGELEFALYATELLKEAKVQKYLDKL
ncbi:MAG: SurA N-terminal domain-containing protein [Proteobacteria bacterium]|nr:SurA N-terminal domain-containing protein [Pseudomonadota bacterium]